MQLSGLLIIGGGGHGKVVADAAMSSGWSRVAFLDDRGQALGSPAGLPILGAVSELQAHAGKFSAAVVALGDGRRETGAGFGGVHREVSRLPVISRTGRAAA